MAVVRLQEPVGNRVGWLGMSLSNSFTNLPLVTAGYPGKWPRQRLRSVPRADCWLWRLVACSQAHFGPSSSQVSHADLSP